MPDVASDQRTIITRWIPTKDHRYFDEPTLENVIETRARIDYEMQHRPIGLCGRVTT